MKKFETIEQSLGAEMNGSILAEFEYMLVIFFAAWKFGFNVFNWCMRKIDARAD